MNSPIITASGAPHPVPGPTGVDASLAELEAPLWLRGEHYRAVVGLSAAVARLLGLAAEEGAEVEQAALPNDTGKVGLPDQMTNEPGPLDELGWEPRRERAALGAHRRLRPGHRSPRTDREGLARALGRQRLPRRSRRGGTPLVGRVFFSCDSLQATTSDRHYRGNIGIGPALEEPERKAVTQVNALVVAALLDAVGRLRPSVLVQRQAAVEWLAALDGQRGQGRFRKLHDHGAPGRVPR